MVFVSAPRVGMLGTFEYVRYPFARIREASGKTIRTPVSAMVSAAFSTMATNESAGSSSSSRVTPPSRCATGTSMMLLFATVEMSSNSLVEACGVTFRTCVMLAQAVISRRLPTPPPGEKREVELVLRPSSVRSLVLFAEMRKSRLFAASQPDVNSTMSLTANVLPSATVTTQFAAFVAADTATAVPYVCATANCTPVENLTAMVRAPE